MAEMGTQEFALEPCLLCARVLYWKQLLHYIGSENACVITGLCILLLQYCAQPIKAGSAITWSTGPDLTNLQSVFYQN